MNNSRSSERKVLNNKTVTDTALLCYQDNDITIYAILIFEFINIF
jgi:hypothetical protein